MENEKNERKQRKLDIQFKRKVMYSHRHKQKKKMVILSGEEAQRKKKERKTDR